MKIFSNTPLSWPSLLHVYTVHRISLKPWNNYHFYKIVDDNPIKIKHKSCINNLKTNYDYCCYWDLYEYKNTMKTSSNWEFKIHINSLSDNYHKTYSNKVINYHNDMERYTHHYNNYIYVPNTIEKDDLIVIHKPNNSGDYPLTPYRSHTSGNTIILA